MTSSDFCVSHVLNETRNFNQMTQRRTEDERERERERLKWNKIKNKCIEGESKWRCNALTLFKLLRRWFACHFISGVFFLDLLDDFSCVSFIVTVEANRFKWLWDTCVHTKNTSACGFLLGKKSSRRWRAERMNVIKCKQQKPTKNVDTNYFSLSRCLFFDERIF